MPITNDVSDANNNTGSGTGTLGNLGTGIANTGSGFQALYANTTGNANTASGANSLGSNMTGQGNTASGLGALYSNSEGTQNTAIGLNALYYNITGKNNTASGVYALFYNMTGSNNTASGFNALHNNDAGGSNTASGTNALYANTSGNSNAAVGRNALYANTSGVNNIGVGYQAGIKLTTGNNNIDIGSAGVAAEANTIRLGTVNRQKSIYVAGIFNSKITGLPLYVMSNGQLGTLASSERYKTAIASMGADTAKLSQLRPVTFKLKSDPKGALQYGLIAEEVAKVYPELVIRDARGRIEGVRYDELAPMLLNEVQQQVAEVNALKQQLAAQAAQLAEMKEMLAALQPQAKVSQVAMRSP